MQLVVAPRHSKQGVWQETQLPPIAMVFPEQFVTHEFSCLYNGVLHEVQIDEFIEQVAQV